MAGIIFTFTSCQQKKHPEYNITFKCYMYEVAIFSESIHLCIYDKKDSLIYEKKINEEGKATVSLKTNETYFIDAYGLDENGEYIDGFTQFYLNSHKTYDYIGIKMEYSEEYY